MPGTTFQREFGTAGGATSAALNAEIARATAAEATISSQMSAALGPVRASTAAAEADGTLTNGSYYYIPSASTVGALDLYLKVSNASSTFQKTIANDVAVAANTAALATINETVTTLTAVNSPPLAADPYVEDWTTITNHATRWTEPIPIVSGNLSMTQTFAGLLLRGIVHKTQQVQPGLYVHTKMVPTTVSSTATGLYVLIAPSAVGGGLLDATHGYAIGWRADGGLVMYRGNGTTAAFSPSGQTSYPFVAGDVVEVGILIDAADVTKATLYRTLNGTPLPPVAYTGLPSTGYIGAAVRQGTSGITAVLTLPDFHMTTRKSRFFYTNASGGGSLGTIGSPTTTLRAAISMRNDRPGDYVEFCIKGGTYNESLGDIIPIADYREITLSAPPGEEVIIQGSTLLASGGSVWTRTAGQTKIWQTASIVGANVGLIVTSLTQDMGAYDVSVGRSGTPRSGYINPFYIPTRFTNVGSAGGGLPTFATQAAQCAALNGSYFSDNTLGLLYFNPPGGGDVVDPNSLVCQRCDANPVLSIPWLAATDMNFCRINLIGIHFRYAYSELVKVQRITAFAENCIFEGGAVLGGLNVDTCYGEAVSCISRYSWGDGFHSDPIDIPTIVKVPTFRFIDCHGYGSLNGQGISAHEMTRHYIQGGEYSYNGLGGIGQAEDTDIIDVTLRNNPTYAISLVGQSVRKTRTVNIRDTVIDGNPEGLLLASFAGDTTVAKMAGGLIKGASLARIQIDNGNLGTTSFTGTDVGDGGGNAADSLGAGSGTRSITWNTVSGFCS